MMWDDYKNGFGLEDFPDPLDPTISAQEHFLGLDNIQE